MAEREAAMTESGRNRDDDDKKPPFFRSWTGCYIFVILHLVLWILLFYWFTRRFSGQG